MLEAPRGRLVAREDRLGVAAAVARDVGQRLVDPVDHLHRQDEVEELGGPVVLRGGRAVAEDAPGGVVHAQLDAALAQRRANTGQQVLGHGAVDQQRLGRVAHAGPRHLRVHRDLDGHRLVGGRLDVDVAVAHAGLDGRHGDRGAGGERGARAGVASGRCPRGAIEGVEGQQRPAILGS